MKPEVQKNATAAPSTENQARKLSSFLSESGEVELRVEVVMTVKQFDLVVLGKSVPSSDLDYRCFLCILLGKQSSLT